MLFKYKGYDQNGKKVSGKVEASNILLAKAQLKQKKIITIYVNEINQPVYDKLKISTKTTLRPDILSNISKTLSIYLDAGISLINGVKLIAESYKENKKLSTFFSSIINLLEEGKNFYTALDSQKTFTIPEFFLQSVKISEDGGILNQVLQELSIYIDEQQKIKKQISQAMTYPIFIIIVSVGMVGFMLSFIVPKITNIFVKNDQALPGITEFIIKSGNFMANSYQYIFILLILSILIYQYSYHKIENFRYKVDTFKLKIPFFGSLIEMSELSRFSYMNAILLKSGITVVQSFKMGANILNNSVIKNIFFEASKKVVEGEKLSKILELNKAYKLEKSFIQAIAIGEETSQLNTVLENLAKLYDSKTKDKLGKFLQILEPLLMLIVGGIIGFIVVAMLLPIFSMSIG